nr:EOG090X0J7Y [Polyphemus pediculus]
MDSGNSKMDKYWVDSPNQCPSYERNLNFTALVSEDDDYTFSKKKVARDPMSHRIIEKRRRDRMNNCLADLSRLLPAAYMKKGRGRIEKTEIIEMTIKHMKHLQIHACKEMETCEIAAHVEQSSNKSEQYKQGFLECISEMIQFLVQVEGYYSGDDFCNRLVNHLQNHCDKVTRDGQWKNECSMVATFNLPTHKTTGDGSAMEGTSSQSDQSALNGNVSGSNQEEQVGSSVSLHPQNQEHNHKDYQQSHEAADNESLNEEREQAMYNYLQQTEGGSDHDRRTNGGSCSGGDSDEAVGTTSRTRRTTGTNSGTPSPEDREGSSPADMDSSSTSQSGSHSSQLREMLLASSDSSSGRAKSSSSSGSSSRNGNSDDFNGMYKFKTPEDREGSSPADMDSSSTSQSGSHSSQLREMLLASSDSSSGRAKSSSSSGSSSRNGNSDDFNGMYKFKTNIHQRFTADLEHVYPQSDNQMGIKLIPNPALNIIQERSYEKYQGVKRKKGNNEEAIPSAFSPVPAHANNNVADYDHRVPTERSFPTLKEKKEANAEAEAHLRKHLDTVIIGTPQPEYPEKETPTQQITENVPIFALHPKGSFYVPMSIELALIGSLFNPPVDPSAAQTVLHPVTISVNFCHPLRLLTRPLGSARQPFHPQRARQTGCTN